MKLSEVIKAIEDGNKNIFKNGKNGEFTAKFIETDDGNNLAVDYFDCEAYYLPLDGWEEVKPPRQWSEKELMLFKLLPGWANWIAQDKESDLCIYETKPIQNQYAVFNQNGKDSHSYEIIDTDIFNFLTITFEESPIYIGDLKGE